MRKGNFNSKLNSKELTASKSIEALKIKFVSTFSNQFFCSQFLVDSSPVSLPHSHVVGLEFHFSINIFFSKNSSSSLSFVCFVISKFVFPSPDIVTAWCSYIVTVSIYCPLQNFSFVFVSVDIYWFIIILSIISIFFFFLSPVPISRLMPPFLFCFRSLSYNVFTKSLNSCNS